MVHLKGSSVIMVLLSRKAMKKANTNINFMEDKVSMFGEDLDVVVTESGHYALPLNEKSKIIKKNRRWRMCSKSDIESCNSQSY